MDNAIFTIKEHILPTSYIREYPGATLGSQEAPLELHLKQYIPKAITTTGKPVTIIATHANGFPKELYEALWEEMHERFRIQGQAIKSIWIADVAWQGKSGIINEPLLGNDPSWHDMARDLFLMINHFRNEMPRPLIGIGHSMGGNMIVNLALMHPRLFSALILMEPIINPRNAGPIEGKNWAGLLATVRASAYRRDRWPSREDAESAVRRNKFYATWDERVLQRLVRHFFRDANPAATLANAEHGSEVLLATSKHQEVFTFLRPNFTGAFSPRGEYVPPNRALVPDDFLDADKAVPLYRAELVDTFNRLPTLRPPVLYILGAESPLAPSQLRQARLKATGAGVGGSGGVAEGRVSEVLVENAGHLLPFERVSEVARLTCDFALQELELWNAAEIKWQKAWNAKSIEARTKLTSEWQRRLGGPLERRRKSML